MCNNLLPAEEWKKNFRLLFREFEKLADQVGHFLEPNPDSPNYGAIDATKRLAIALCYLKDTGSLRMTANAFGIHVSTASKIIHQVCNVIAFKLGPNLIKLPNYKSQMHKKSSEFEVKYGMPQAFGCIDGTHVRIKRPSENSQDYYSYKMYFSLNVQALCDFCGLFMDVDCRWPGSVHDAKVFANSAVNKNLRNGDIPVTYQQLLPGSTEVPSYLIGDPAYPLTPFCMKEFETCSDNSQVIFNNILRSARNPIECAFGRLKARWSFLTSTVDLKLDFVPIAVYACFVLHNYCELNHCTIDQNLVEQQISKHMHDERQHKGLTDQIYSGNTDEGKAVREAIRKYMEDNLPDHLTA